MFGYDAPTEYIEMGYVENENAVELADDLSKEGKN